MTRISSMTTRMVLTGLVIATGFAAQAAGDGQGKMGGKMHKERPSFSVLDADGNGELTKEELAMKGRERFEARDTNGDGKLSAEEIAAGVQEHAIKKGKKRAGKLARGEGKAKQDFEKALAAMERRRKRAAKMFDRIDADGNGTVSEQEYAQMKGMGHGKHKNKMRGDN